MNSIRQNSRQGIVSGGVQNGRDSHAQMGKLPTQRIDKFGQRARHRPARPDKERHNHKLAFARLARALVTAHALARVSALQLFAQKRLDALRRYASERGSRNLVRVCKRNRKNGPPDSLRQPPRHLAQREHHSRLQRAIIDE
ncbi:hypothetical protein AXK12_03215 [Cephaloticoccus capnophilus]|uniref:Uncharacterized protein n=1 Tax=Cephaloticoccus capnophilus TaxID=1548208 RepID=A0A139SPF3_9BACT|nr:hypothetical protein AXK12_03215 [Cephaloticoccus capnophilus]